MEDRVWLIGGTSDSAAIAKILAEHKISFIVSVATQTAQNLYSANTLVTIGCMNREQMQCFCHREKVTTIVDASHPYALEVSQSAIAISAELNLSYLRYERNYAPQPNSNPFNSLIIELDSFQTLVAGDYLRGQKVLLTIGCKTLSLFKSWQEQSTLYTRVLPKISSLTMALDAGFTSDRIIAFRPPLNIALETALWQQWQISLVVTKASGKAGGEDIKRQVAANLNIPLIIIARPQIDYPQQTNDLQEILVFCRSIICAVND